MVIQNISASFSELFPNYVPPSPLPRKVGGHDLPPAPMGAPPLVAHLHHRLYIDAGKQLQGLAQTDRLRTATVFTQRSAVERGSATTESLKMLSYSILIDDRLQATSPFADVLINEARR